MALRDYLDLRTIALFGLAGPIVGLVAYLAVLLTRNPSGIEDLLPGGLVLVLPAYVLGLVPALLTGLGFGAIRLRLLDGKSQNYMIGAATGVLLGFVFTLVWLLMLTSTSDARAAILFGFIGAFSGGTCSLAAKWLRVGSNNSFKPKPLRGSA